ncbi:MAG: cytochrome c oxidase assembly protein CtaG/Cox11-domain-containing protein [Piptocephalis tieghemiana]|nr:MAG: cytochrome c oxidase assembly protein CtaG/Cox11-domain-containing protein [Piptocephalis tieghemiana]
MHRLAPPLSPRPARILRLSSGSASRFASSFSSSQFKDANSNGLLYTASVLIVGVGITYAAVPLYRAFCGATGLGGNPLTDASKFTRDKLIPVTEAKRYRITFNSDVSEALRWRFKPQQRDIYVLPGETALSFFTATNTSKEDLVGISTYNVTPNKAGAYFNKVQCFCFEEQMLRAGESVDMPVFFFLDPEIAEDPLMADVDTITLSYTFFNARKA